MATFGTPKYGSSKGTYPRSLDCKDGKVVTVRILPPLGKCAPTGEWFVSHAQHYGYAVKGGERITYCNFYCLEKSMWKNDVRVITQRCPECDEIAKRKAKHDADKAIAVGQGLTQTEIREKFEKAAEWVKAHNRAFQFYVNVKDSSGEFYTLKLPVTVKKAIEAICEKYRNRKPSYDAIDADGGLWFAISASGKGLQREYHVEEVKEGVEIDGQTLERPKKAPLTEADGLQALASCCYLHEVGIRTLSPEKIQALVDSHGDSDTISDIWGLSDREPVETESSEPPPPPVKAAPPPQPVKPPPVKEPPAPVKTVEPEPFDEEDDVAKAMKALAEAQAKKKAKQAPVAKPAPKSETTEDEEADFMKQFAP
jgi:hypothetical protein